MSRLPIKRRRWRQFSLRSLLLLVLFLASAIGWRLHTAPWVGWHSETQDGIYASLFSPDERKVALGVGDRRNRIVIKDADSGRSVTELTCHESSISDFAWMPDGQQIVLCRADGITQIIKPDSGACTLTLEESLDREDTAVTVCPGARRLITKSKIERVDMMVTVCPNTHRLITTSKIRNMSSSADVKYGYSVWDMDTGGLLKRFDHEVRMLAADHEGNRLLLGRIGKDFGPAKVLLEVWDLARMEMLLTIPRPPRRRLLRACFVGLQNHIYTEELENMTSHSDEPLIQAGRNVSGATDHISQDPKKTVPKEPPPLFAAPDPDPIIRRTWNSQTGKQMTGPTAALPASVFHGAKWQRWTPAFQRLNLVSPDGSRKAARAADGTIVLMDAISEKILHILPGTRLDDEAGVIRFSPSGRRILAAAGIDEGSLWVFTRRRPEPWWGAAWLVEFWLTALFTVGLVCSLSMDWKG